jgi:hypothetical protein
LEDEIDPVAGATSPTWMPHSADRLGDMPSVRDATAMRPRCSRNG